MAKKRGLGRGLDALLSGSGLPGTDAEAAAHSQESLKQLPVDLVERGQFQPRQHFDQDSLAALAESIKSQGVVQPVVVRPLGGGRFELIAGERRWRAAQLAGLASIPAVVRELPDSAALAVALIENIQREELNPLEEARALKRLIDEFEMTHQSAADAVGRSRAAVSNALRLLELAPAVADMLERGLLEMGHARALLALQAPAQRTAAERIVARKLTVRQAEALVRTLLAPPPSATARRVDPDLHRLQERLSAHLSAQVRLQHRANGKGRLSIDYNSLEELDGVLGRLGLNESDVD